MSVTWGAGFHAPDGRRVDESAYGRYIGRWSRLFVPALLAAVSLGEGDQVLDVATGPGEAAAAVLSAVGPSGFVVGVDISRGMLETAATRMADRLFRPVAADGQALPFRDGSFDAVVCQLGLMFFPDPAVGLAECRRVLRPGRRAAACVISTPDRAPMWGILAETVSRHLPDQAEALHLSFALSNAERLEQIFIAAGFRDVRVTPETRAGTIASFDEYWAPIEDGSGQIPQAYVALPEPTRRAVRAEVRALLAPFESNGQYAMSVDMFIGTGQK